MNDVDLLAPLGTVEPPDHEVMREVAALLAAEPETVRRTRLSRSRRTLFIGGGAAAAGVAIVAVLTLMSEMTAPAVAPPRAAAAPSTPDASAIAGYVLTAFDNTDLIMHEFRTDKPAGDPSTYTYENWISTPYPKVGENYSMRGRLTKNGVVYQDYSAAYRIPAPGTPAPEGCPAQVPNGLDTFTVHADSTVVDYGNRTWSRTTAECFETGTDDQGDVRAQIAAGQWQRVPGEQTIDGQQVIELTTTQPVPATLWANADTYLPVRSDMHLGGDTMTTNFDFLPDTASNRALLTSPIPPGFTKTTGQ